MGNAVRRERIRTETPSDFSDKIFRLALYDYYKPERIYAKRIDAVSADEYCLTFSFSAYERSLRPIGHVSANQIDEAIIEASFCAFCAMSLADHGPLHRVGEHAGELKRELIYLQQNITFRELLPEGREAFLNIKLDKVERVRLRNDTYLITFNVSGFATGSLLALLDAGVVRAKVGRDLLDTFSFPRLL